jgi:hypothetical protein
MPPFYMRTSETFSTLTDPAFGDAVIAADFFVKGSCHQLALALVSAIDGARFVAVYDHLSDCGTPLNNPWMVHAAAMVDDNYVIDVEGIMDRDVWAEAWSDLARKPSYVEWPPGELPFEFTSAAHMRFAKAVAKSLIEELGEVLSRPQKAPLHFSLPKSI